MSSIRDLIAEFNVLARTEYNKQYMEFDPLFKKAMMFEYSSGMRESVDFPFFGFLQQMEQFTGSRKHQTFPEGYKFTVTNKEWDMAVDVFLKDLERASEAKNRMQGLDIYRLRIGEMAKMVKDHPVELAYTMLEAGAASTYGTCFDGQNLFDTTHNYGVVAGTQSNILTGTGTSVTQMKTDVLSAITKFNSFTYQQSPDTAARKLNRRTQKILIVAPLQLDGVLYELKNSTLINNGDSNAVKDMFDYITLPLVDTNDWYAVLDDETIFKPFLYQVEKPAVLDMPTPSDESWRENRKASYGAYGRYNVAYGSWWKAVQVTNT